MRQEIEADERARKERLSLNESSKVSEDVKPNFTAEVVVGSKVSSTNGHNELKQGAAPTKVHEKVTASNSSASSGRNTPAAMVGDDDHKIDKPRPKKLKSEHGKVIDSENLLITFV